ncbi:MAG TPA: helix-turn-helix domain-containing protein [bacterium]|jgi:transcriptional regulator with XRE-family HTH domain|nr:helix-turn-helix domain-containing protein [bacterium]
MICGKRIREIRIILKKNQKLMAEELGISQSYLCAIERGAKRPNGNTIIKLVNNFHVSCLWLMDGTGPEFLDCNDICYIRSAEVNEKAPLYNFPVLKQYLRDTVGINADMLNFYIADSDNMEPAIKKNDIVLVDTSENLCDMEGVYLFRIESRKFLGRLLFFPQKHIVNDNPTIKNSSRIFDSSVECVGKIVWFCRKL